MMKVYDMSSGQVIADCLTNETRQVIAPDASLPELQLQLVTPEQRAEREIPPDMVMADLSAFLDKMG
ncbi:MAG: hypothetical protein B6D72_19790 [gamma proteobacterium symbiont of Ctena orbiculata]|uniref:Uncharacterized protein n=1 Tax=Candidatus Thiodiazotropha taylori TaxID=2792791 RepID=A0A944QTC3_9GAMM|nr:hypothetical protein [Candidatus Thiodiazotropha taylori]PUB89051.1 MAG: hypothetical protein DBP00_03625 [gamma proteobacterium symbiont of Ctena orbiculata]MBT2987481.1 hypothetical protein [Candidatus Thiodiazotropha taylori]MBT2995263.1 hypothetical protein [Candidatus Thiodiazotropha taylori]MBT2999818.1 hypothetical protein [Candidatus Thiodiazotropha taylori]